MQIVERSSLEIRTAIWSLASKLIAPTITLFPMIHVADPRFYIAVKDRLADFDFILFEGLESRVTDRIIKSYSLFPNKEKNG